MRDVLEGRGGGGGGRGGLKRRGGGGLAGSPYGTFLILNPLGTEGAEAKFWLSASNIGMGRRGWGV